MSSVPTAAAPPVSLAGNARADQSRAMHQPDEPRVPSLIERLKQRKVVQWAIGYLAGAFVALQLMDALEGPLELSQRTQQSVVVLLAVGLVLTAIVAWFHGDKGHQRVTPAEIVALGITLVVGISVAAMPWAGSETSVAPGVSAESGSESVLSPSPEEGATTGAGAQELLPDSEPAPVAPEGSPIEQRRPAASRIPPPTLAPENLTLFAGDSVRLKLDPDQPAYWATSDGSVARVMSDGLVLAAGPGSARITATVGEAEVSTLLTVLAVLATEVEIAPVGPMRPGESVRPEVLVQMSNGQTRGRGGLQWSTSDSSVVRIENRGTVFAVGPGSARVVAERDGVSGSIELIVEPHPEARPPTQPASSDVLFPVLEAYRVALEGRDIEEVAAVYPGISPDERAGWETLFRLGDLSVEFSLLTVLAATSTSAEVEFEQTLSGDRIERNVTSFIATLVSTDEGWRIQGLRAGGIRP